MVCRNLNINQQSKYLLCNFKYRKVKASCLICDHEVLNNVRSEFIYIATKPIDTYALKKKFLIKDVFPKYPEIAELIK